MASTFGNNPNNAICNGLQFKSSPFWWPLLLATMVYKSAVLMASTFGNNGLKFRFFDGRLF